MAAAPAPSRNGHHSRLPDTEKRNGTHHVPARLPDQELLRRVSWEIGEQKHGEQYAPAACHISLATVAPHQGFVHWRLLPSWVDETARSRGPAWHQCRMIVRLYDVSYIEFDGFNAHHVMDVSIGHLSGHLIFNLPRPGTTQMAEVGFVLRNGEFIAAARSAAVRFPPDSVCGKHSHAALLVDERGRVEEIGNLWEQDKVLEERRKPRLRPVLRIAAFSLCPPGAAQDGAARFVSELASGQQTHGHEVHLFAPATSEFRTSQEINGVVYHPLEVSLDRHPLDAAVDYAHAAEKRLRDLPPFDLLHLHEWMTGLAPWIGTRPTVLSLSSIEAIRRNGSPPTPLSLEIQQAERQLAHAVDCILTPDWLRERAITELGIDSECVHAFPMEARLPNEWSETLDYGQVKREFGIGPLDRVILYVGPLEHAAGVDLLVEALPVLHRRAPNLRLAYVGTGNMHNALLHRAHELGVGHAVRLLGHVEGTGVKRLLRAAEALVLPSRCRIPFDDAVVNMARRVGRPVVTTHSGPGYLVKHEENGLLTYDNPGSMLWALDRVLGDPGHAEEMGRRGRYGDAVILSWAEVARHYLELCAVRFPELRVEEGK